MSRILKNSLVRFALAVMVLLLLFPGVDISNCLTPDLFSVHMAATSPIGSDHPQSCKVSYGSSRVCRVRQLGGGFYQLYELPGLQVGRSGWTFPHIYMSNLVLYSAQKRTDSTNNSITYVSSGISRFA